MQLYEVDGTLICTTYFIQELIENKLSPVILNKT